MKYEHWMKSVAEDTAKHVLKTVTNILDDADKKLTSTELEDIGHAWQILSMLDKLCHEHESKSDTNLDDAAGYVTKYSS